MEYQKATISHDVCLAAIEYDPGLDSFFGNVVDLSSPVTFYGKTTGELRREYAASINEYLAVCEERGIQPEKPFSGRITVRTDPQLHREMAGKAAAGGKSLNAWIAETLKERAHSGIFSGSSQQENRAGVKEDKKDYGK